VADVFDIFVHNWAAAVAVESVWAVDVTTSPTNLVESRRILAGKPMRRISVRWTGVTQAEAARLLWATMRRSQQRLRIPLYPDVSVLTAASSGTTIHAPTTDLRFAVGQRVVVFTGRAVAPQHRVIASLTSSTIVTTVALTGTVAAGALVLPVLDVELELAGEIVPLTDGKAEVTATFQEVPELAIPAAAADYAAISGDYGTADSVGGQTYYVLPLAPNWGSPVSVGVKRAGADERLGRGRAVVPRWDGPQLVLGWHVDLVRDEYYQLLRFFDAHRGGAVPFFVVNPITALEAVNVGDAFVDARVVQDLTSDVENGDSFFSYLALETTDGDLHIRKITGVDSDSGNVRYLVSPDWPALSVPEIARLTFAHFVRFDDDVLRESWVTNGLASIDLAFAERPYTEREVALDEGNAAAATTKTSRLKARFLFASGDEVKVTNWTSDVAGYSALPAIEVRGLKNTGALDVGTITIEVAADAAGIADMGVATGAPNPTLYLHLAEEITAYGPSGSATRTILHSIGDYQLKRVYKNPDGRFGILRMDFTSVKDRMAVPLGRAATPACDLTLGDKTCLATVTPETATIAAISRHKITLTNPADAAVVTGKPSGDAPYWHRGVVTVGALSIGIRGWVDGSYDLELVEAPPSWWLGELATLRPGCARTPGDCAGKFSNLERFSGIGIKILSYNPQFEVTA
jgi:hypothetical protein